MVVDGIDIDKILNAAPDPGTTTGCWDPAPRHGSAIEPGPYETFDPVAFSLGESVRSAAGSFGDTDFGDAPSFGAAAFGDLFGDLFGDVGTAPTGPIRCTTPPPVMDDDPGRIYCG